MVGCVVALLGVVGCLVGLLVVLGLVVVLLVETGLAVVVCLALGPPLTKVRPHRPQGGWTHRPHGTRSDETSMDESGTITPIRESRRKV